MAVYVSVEFIGHNFTLSLYRAVSASDYIANTTTPAQLFNGDRIVLILDEDLKAVDTGFIQAPAACFIPGRPGGGRMGRIFCCFLGLLQYKVQCR